VPDRRISMDVIKEIKEEILKHPMRKALINQLSVIKKLSTCYAMNRDGDLQVFYDLSAKQEELVDSITALMFSIEESVFAKYGLERSSFLEAGGDDYQES
jgi:septation ring formation regulator EzrA